MTQRADIISFLRAHPDQTATQVSHAVGVRPGSVASLLFRLFQAGQVSRQHKPGKIGWRYRLVLPCKRSTLGVTRARTSWDILLSETV